MPTGLSHLRPLDAGEWAELEAAVGRFASAWRRAERPAVRDHLPAGGRVRLPLLVELVHTELELRLKAGEPARVEEYLQAHPELEADRTTVLGLIAAEWEFRRRADPTVSATEYRYRFPAHAADLADGLKRTTVDARATPSRTPPPATDVPPAVPGYDLDEPLGRGGMGVVYRARQLSLDRPAAVKFLPAECARDPAWLARFRREARTASALNHPHICTVYDTGEAGGRPYLCMELIDGRTLAAVIADRPPVAEASRLVRQAAQALAAAHAAGVVHRDVKPENLMARPDGIVKVLDFGLAYRPADPRLSGCGLAGTPAYMAPEQARGDAVGPPADVFALGLVLYELLTGRHPFPAVTALLAGLELDPVPPARLNPEVPAPLDALVLLMLAHDPAARPTAAEVEAALAARLPGRSGPLGRPPVPAPRTTVGRRAELDALHAAYAEAAAGRGAVACVTGEPGYGKTTVVEQFLHELAVGACPPGVAAGRCSERLAGAEAYLPFLEAVDGLLRGGGPAAAAALRQLAPSWHARVVPAAEPTAADAPQERLKREFAAFLEAASRGRPLVLFLDDVHWADPSSTDLLAYLGGRAGGGRVLFVVTYRPSDLALARHPFGPVKLALQARRLAREVPLDLLTRADLDGYLAASFPGHRFPAEFLEVVHARTGGHPLFMADLLRYLRDRGVLAADAGGWALARPVGAFDDELPASVRGMVERELGQLTEADRQVLAAASVQGPEFDSAVLAAVVQADPAAVEDRLDELHRTHALLRFVREHELPDGTPSLRYRFSHVLYQNALLAGLRPTRRAVLSRATAGVLLAHHPDGGATVAADLAILFEAARDPARAVDFFRRAARNAVRVSAHEEAAGLARRGLALLPKLTADDRGRHEAPLLVALGVSLMATRGFAAPEVEATYRRAADLLAGADAADRFPVLYGLWNVYLLRAEIDRCAELAGEMAALAAGHPDPVVAVQADNVVQQPLVHRGEFAAARRLQERALAAYDRHAPANLTAVYGEDPGVGCQVYAAITLWALGHPEEAVRAVADARRRAAALGHPFDRARSLYFGGFVHLLRGDAGRVAELATELAALAEAEGYTLLVSGSRFLRGWARAAAGEPDGIPLMRTAVAGWQATGAVSHRPHQLAVLGRAVAAAGDVTGGLELLSQAEALTAATGERFLEAELHRLRGDVLANAGRTAEAEASYHVALAVAQRQGARTLEARAAAGLAAVG